MHKREELEIIVTTNAATIKQCQKVINKAKDELEALDRVTYAIGDRFKDADGRKYMLSKQAQIGTHVSMTNLTTGGLWSGNNSVANLERITADEFTSICAGTTFTRYWDIRKGELTPEKPDDEDDDDDDI